MIFVVLTSDTNDDFEQRLAKDKLVLLVGCSPVVVYMCQCDYMLYQCIVDVLILEVLQHKNHYYFVTSTISGHEMFVKSLLFDLIIIFLIVVISTSKSPHNEPIFTTYNSTTHWHDSPALM